MHTLKMRISGSISQTAPAAFLFSHSTEMEAGLARLGKQDSSLQKQLPAPGTLLPPTARDGVLLVGIS